MHRTLQCAAALGLVLPVSGCTDPYDPGQRAAGGALIGAAIGGGPGALTGALVGGGVGAATGVLTAPPRPQPYSPPPPD